MTHNKETNPIFMMIICLWESAGFLLVISPPYHDAKECSQSCNWTQTAGKYATGMRLPYC